MTYYEKGSIVGNKGLFEDILTLYVHMVGRLVQEQEIMAFKHQAGHSQAGSLSSAKHCHLFIYVFSPKEELGQYVPDLSPDLPYGYPVQSLKYAALRVQNPLLRLSEIAQVHVMPQAALSPFWL